VQPRRPSSDEQVLLSSIEPSPQVSQQRFQSAHGVPRRPAQLRKPKLSTEQRHPQHTPIALSPYWAFRRFKSSSDILDLGIDLSIITAVSIHPRTPYIHPRSRHLQPLHISSDTHLRPSLIDLILQISSSFLVPNCQSRTQSLTLMQMSPSSPMP
jgi:hypothetical protein